MPIRSPGSIPAATRPFATSMTSARNWAAVTSRHAPPTLRRNDTALGASSALVYTTSAMPPLSGTLVSGGTAISRMILLLGESSMTATSR
jgi:hypothetical protein